jgi:N-acetylneuraminic acid mutarotase
MSARSILILTTLALHGLASNAQAQGTGTAYALQPDSTFSRGCFPPCLCAIATTDAFHGTFTLTFVRSDGLFNYYAVGDIAWTGDLDGGPIAISGSGVYQIGGEFALEQRLTLTLTVGDQTSSFDSGLIQAKNISPRIEVTVSINHMTCYDTVIGLRAAPVASGTWTTLSPLPAPKTLHGAATGSDGRVYAFGGTSDDGPPVTATVFAYDVNADTWTSTAPLAAGPRRNFAYASDASGLIYAIGGYDFSGPPFALNRVEQYDPSADAWNELPDMPTRRQGAAAASGPDGRIYVMGGTDTSFQTVAVTEIFDPAADAWTAAAPMNTPRTGFGAAAGSDGRIYVFGGYSGDAYVATVEAYDPASDTWVPVSPMNEARYGVAGVAGPDERIYAIGGGQDGTSVEAYDPSTDTWTAVASMSVPRFGHAATLGLDSRIYAIGGDTAVEALGFTTALGRE